MSPVLAEFIGTMILIIFGGGVVAGVVLKGTKSEASGWIVITFGWGLGVAMAVYAVGNISGAHINPAVTVGLAAVGDFPWASVPGYILGQVAGAFTGGVLVYFHYYPHWKETQDQGAKLAVFSTGPAIKHTPQNFYSEVLGTFVLLFGIMFLGGNAFSDGLGPLIIGLLIVVIGLSLGGTTGYAINPARDLGPRIAHALLPIAGKGSSDWGYSWIPIAGPIIGGGLGSTMYVALYQGNPPMLLWVFIAAFFVVLFVTMQMQKKDVGKNIQQGEEMQHNPEERAN